MPEMPEVETIARNLRKTIVGKRVAGIRLSGLPLRKSIPKGFVKHLKGRTIKRIHRRGKYLVVEMKPRAYWLMHLGMSGRILYNDRASRFSNHTHAVIRFSDTTTLEYRDPRRFGLLASYEGRRLAQIPELRNLGKDPMSSTFNAEWLRTRLCRSRQEVKSFLLDQRRIAGLGNIYACEALFEAGLHPARRCWTISRNETKRLVRSIQKVLRSAIRHHGTSFSDFMDIDGRAGENQDFLYVYQRHGQDCRRCGTDIRRLVHGNRSSYYCPCCQPEPIV